MDGAFIRIFFGIKDLNVMNVGCEFLVILLLYLFIYVIQSLVEYVVKCK